MGKRAAVAREHEAYLDRYEGEGNGDRGTDHEDAGEGDDLGNKRVEAVSTEHIDACGVRAEHEHDSQALREGEYLDDMAAWLYQDMAKADAEKDGRAHELRCVADAMMHDPSDAGMLDRARAAREGKAVDEHERFERHEHAGERDADMHVRIQNEPAFVIGETIDTEKDPYGIASLLRCL